MGIGERLKKIRIILRLSGYDIAKKLGVTPTTVYTWELEQFPIPASRIVDYSDTFHINLDWIEKGVGEMFAPDVGLTFDSWIKESEANRMLWLREKLGLSLLGFSKKLNIPRTTVLGFENNKRRMYKYIPLICEATGVRREWLETGEGEMFEQDRGKRSQASLTSTERTSCKKEEQVVQQTTSVDANSTPAPVPFDKSVASDPARLGALFQIALCELDDQLFTILQNAVYQEEERRAALRRSLNDNSTPPK